MDFFSAGRRKRPLYNPGFPQVGADVVCISAGRRKRPLHNPGFPLVGADVVCISAGRRKRPLHPSTPLPPLQDQIGESQ